MTHFCSPQATTAKVAARFKNHPQITLASKLHKSARTFHLTPIATRAGDTSFTSPKSLTLIFDGEDQAKPTQLYIDRLPIRRKFWNWDHHRGILSWRLQAPGVPHGARLAFSLGGTRLIGSFETDRAQVGIAGTLAPVSFTCSVAQNAGATASGTGPDVVLHWDPGSPQWKNATWISSALQFTYQVVGQIIVGQKTYSVAVQYLDQQTNTPWIPDQTTVGTLVTADLDFTTILNAGFDPPTDGRQGLKDPNARAIATVFPYQMSFLLTEFGNAFNGAMLTGKPGVTGTVLGVQGIATNPSVVGLYAVESQRGRGAFSVHGGVLHVEDKPVDRSRMRGNCLDFAGLSAAQQAASGLPAEGTIEFSDDGGSFVHQDVTGRRVAPDDVATHFARTAAAAHPVIAAVSNIAAARSLSLTELANMTQFQHLTDPQTKQTYWADVVQQSMMADFNQVLLYYMSSDLRQTFYGQAQVNLSPALLQIAATAPSGQTPGSWYQSLAVAFLTNVLSTWNQDGAAQLNAIRARAWLKSQTALSPVFQVQSSAMYAMEWPTFEQNANIYAYLQDQVANAGTYFPFIQQDQQQWLSELQQTIVDASALATMTNIVNNLATAAINNKLYWAYAYFRYITTPQALTEIQMVSLGADRRSRRLGVHAAGTDRGRRSVDAR
jgi:hypothetical protein